ncbi:MAG TPA: hypothetical protein VLL98_00690 [Rickettsiales bacterium]|nr:hypothetical protein [Rickettsiales bacterium]
MENKKNVDFIMINDDFSDENKELNISEIFEELKTKKNISDEYSFSLIEKINSKIKEENFEKKNNFNKIAEKIIKIINNNNLENIDISSKNFEIIINFLRKAKISENNLKYIAILLICNLGISEKNISDLWEILDNKIGYEKFNLYGNEIISILLKNEKTPDCIINKITKDDRNLIEYIIENDNVPIEKVINFVNSIKDEDFRNKQYNKFLKNSKIPSELLKQIFDKCFNLFKSSENIEEKRNLFINILSVIKNQNISIELLNEMRSTIIEKKDFFINIEYYREFLIALLSNKNINYGFLNNILLKLKEDLVSSSVLKAIAENENIKFIESNLILLFLNKFFGESKDEVKNRFNLEDNNIIENKIKKQFICSLIFNPNFNKNLLLQKILPFIKLEQEQDKNIILQILKSGDIMQSSLIVLYKTLINKFENISDFKSESLKDDLLIYNNGKLTSIAGHEFLKQILENILKNKETPDEIFLEVVKKTKENELYRSYKTDFLKSILQNNFVSSYIIKYIWDDNFRNQERTAEFYNYFLKNPNTPKEIIEEIWEILQKNDKKLKSCVNNFASNPNTNKDILLHIFENKEKFGIYNIVSNSAIPPYIYEKIFADMENFKIYSDSKLIKKILENKNISDDIIIKIWENRKELKLENNKDFIISIIKNRCHIDKITKNILEDMDFKYSGYSQSIISEFLENPKTSDYILERIYEKIKGKDCCNILQNIKLSSNFLKNIYEKEKQNILENTTLIYSCLKNPNTPAKILKDIYLKYEKYKDFYWIINPLIVNPNTPTEVLEDIYLKIKNTKDINEIITFLNKNQNLTAEVLKDKYLDFQKSNIFNAITLIIKNPNTSEKVFKDIYSNFKKFEFIKYSLILKNNCPLEIFNENFKDSLNYFKNNSYIAFSNLIENPNTDSNKLKIIFSKLKERNLFNNHFLYISFLKAKNLPIELFLEILSDKNEINFIINEILEKPYFPADRLEAILRITGKFDEYCKNINLTQKANLSSNLSFDLLINGVCPNTLNPNTNECNFQNFDPFILKKAVILNESPKNLSQKNQRILIESEILNVCNKDKMEKQDRICLFEYLLKINLADLKKISYVLKELFNSHGESKITFKDAKKLIEKTLSIELKNIKTNTSRIKNNTSETLINTTSLSSEAEHVPLTRKIKQQNSVGIEEQTREKVRKIDKQDIPRITKSSNDDKFEFITKIPPPSFLLSSNKQVTVENTGNIDSKEKFVDAVLKSKKEQKEGKEEQLQ